jgi:anti-sigma regulatory factor (Ser/Thr protein kinase)/predicted transcriptional regulator
MSFTKDKRNKIEKTILNIINNQKRGTFLVQRTIAKECGISTQSVFRIIKKLENEGRILLQKDGCNNIYSLPQKKKHLTYDIAGLIEDKVYQNNVAEFIHDVPQHIKNNFAYAFMEMLNNAIEHSDGTKVEIYLERNECQLSFVIIDDGVGIFTKIADTLNLDEKRYAILELSKGKFTSAPDSHSGEGIFFSSKCGHRFILESEGIVFYVSPRAEFLDEPTNMTKTSGTLVSFEIKTDQTQTLEELFKQYTDAPERYGFSKTVIPIRLLEYGDKSPVFISRSQARRLLARIERFEIVMLDFFGVESIGQGFADEVFRVFKQEYPNIKLIPINYNETIHQMIQHIYEFK